MSLARLTRERKQLLEAQQCGETAPSTSANTTAASVNSFSAAQGRIRADMQKLDGVMSEVRYTGPRRIFHPNIEGDDGKEDWGVCLGIQTEWRPTCTIKDMVVAIEMLFALPNYDDPLPGVAKTAAQILKDEPSRFELIAKRWMGGNYII
ncbi:Ubiquitin-conjugating enzyme family protein [Leishmania donovani]|uniref:Ubiquitin-conjugating enzyme family protein n=1 Tax=Leishmania donovani TaxID=5661 RepID=A0A504X9Y2_LEIDO|nr:Ubiquitin-conjugating enzyme family protein [Leishmania donovani]